jgi:hypothetical protein
MQEVTLYFFRKFIYIHTRVISLITIIDLINLSGKIHVKYRVKNVAGVHS